MKRLRGFYLAFLWLSLAGCGWQLRGVGTYQGPTSLHLVPEDRFAPLTLALLDAMHRGAVTPKEDAAISLYLGNEELQRRVVAVTSIGSPVQYELSLSTDFRYQLAGDKTLSTPQTLSVERVFDFDPSNTVAKGEEENTLLEEMRLELAQRILRHARNFSISHGQNQP
jgi:outer membrane lipopolysaccharide assembly protein LptE/RlpB